MTASPERSITVEGVRLRFAAAHMATFQGTCEPLHGHNYLVHVEAAGDLTADAWVWDFGGLKQMTRAICEQLDHKFLLQRTSTHLQITEHDDAWEVAYGERRYVFPKSDVAVLPIENTTAERIAELFAGHLDRGLTAAGAANIRRLRVGIEEMPGQTGWYMIDR